ncbi:acetyltransferase [Gracilibacillus caseinilyticus]|uniref:Acetyltransferase n=1 Tax=Gracilibacillus caseinilyticus TaxID=2932256 RepID=A0ABY4F1B4_9BACI|nr:acetyltransferase [Gracilibacillus caseinilyticus]UOQ50323.1 acetyltransferase [Gracilibacillus caseinilyticus]
MNKKLLIIGASGHGKVVADIALKMKNWETVVFLDDNEKITKSLGLKVVGTSKDIDDYLDEYDIFVGIGNNNTREKVQNKLISIGASIPSLIHPNAIIGEEVEIGKGTAIMAGAIINSCTTIGNGCIINTASTIDHDNIVKDYVHVSPGAHLAGTVEVGKASWIGIGSIIINNTSIKNDCIVGAGAVVINDLTESGTYVGVPAKIT